MVINVKATKTTSEADAAEQYTLKSMDKKSNLPLLLGGFATCIVVYVKSLFMQAGARPEEPSEPAKPEDAAHDRSVKLQLVSISNDPDGAKGVTGGGISRRTRSLYLCRTIRFRSARPCRRNAVSVLSFQFALELGWLCGVPSHSDSEQ